MGDQVVVSANYRLGALGFMAAEEAGIHGNMAVQDVLLALSWVRDNNEAFGGDPVRDRSLCLCYESFLGIMEPSDNIVER